MEVLYMRLKINDGYIIEDFNQDYDFKKCIMLESKYKNEYQEIIKKYPELEYKENDHIKNFLRYRLVNEILEKEYKFKVFDCDNSNGRCALSQHIYNNLWHDDWNANTKILYGGDKYSGDTMNSFWTTYKTALQIYYNEFGNKVGGKEPNIRYALDNYDNFPEVNEKDYIKNFAKLTHTIGNFTLIPKGFNGNRGFTKFNDTGDYWDLTLYYLKHKKYDDEIWQETYKFYTDRKIKKYFLEDYFLEDYIDEQVLNDLTIKLFFKNHLNEVLIGQNIDLADDHQKAVAIDNLKTCVNTINDCIEKRGKKMMDNLSVKLMN